MTKPLSYYVRCISPENTRFEQNEVLEVTSISAAPDGVVLLGLDGNKPIWREEFFEEVVVVHPSYDDSVVRYEAPDAVVEIPLSEYNELLKDSAWWAAAVNMKIHEWSYFGELVAEFNRLEKEES